MARTNIPSMLEYILGQQRRGDLAPEEMMMLSQAEGLPPPDMVAGNDPKRESWLRSIFSRNPQTPPARRAEDLVSPGSIGDQIRQRRRAADAAGEEVSMLPQDMMVAAGPSDTMTDAYGGVSMPTRAAMHQLGKDDPTGELGDMMIGRQAPSAPTGPAAKVTVRGAQSNAQREQLIRLLMSSRGLSRAQAEAMAAGVR